MHIVAQMTMCKQEIVCAEMNSSCLTRCNSLIRQQTLDGACDISSPKTPAHRQAALGIHRSCM